VTQAQWEEVMGDNPSAFHGCGSSCPVEQVNWHMAANFANAVSTAEGLDACYDCSGSGTLVRCDVATNPYQCEGYRLPTEAEWEAAARCAKDTLYAGSDNAEAVAWTSDNSGSTSHSVGAKSPNACGLYDMSGNVWEWTQDWYHSYEDDSTDPVGAQSDDSRVLRGGSWNDGPAVARVAYRFRFISHRRSYLGLRLVRTNP
jgi:formylglycine-generating enzyme required for sulfatase activity